LSTLSIASLSKGRAFALSLLRPMFLSGMLSCLVYIVSVRSSYPTLGVLTGTLFAYGLAGLTGWFIYRARAFRGGHWDGEGSEGS
jgi:hypothetical protein